MPIHDLGYRGWNGQRRSIYMLWSVIAITGIKIAARSQWIRRTLVFSWIPALSLGVFFFFYEQAIENNWFVTSTPMVSAIEGMGESGRVSDLHILAEGLSAQGDEIGRGRKIVWSWLFTSFFKYSQGAMMLLLVGLIAPPLISKDVRTRAFLLYFSRPIGRAEYILGKICVPAFFVAGITLIPGLLLYMFGVLLAPSFSVIMDTWDLPLRIVAASLVTIVPTSCLALMFSSLTNESRFAGFAWFALWALGSGAWLIIYAALYNRAMHQSGGRPPEVIDSQFSMLSLYHTVGKTQRWIFGLEPDFKSVLPSLCLLLGLTVFSLIVLWRRVSAPIRV